MPVPNLLLSQMSWDVIASTIRAFAFALLVATVMDLSLPQQQYLPVATMMDLSPSTVTSSPGELPNGARPSRLTHRVPQRRCLELDHLDQLMRTPDSLLGEHLSVPSVPIVDGRLLSGRLHGCLCTGRRSLHVLLLGGSMAQGLMNCGGNITCGDSSRRAWGALLQSRLPRILGGNCSISVHVDARGGRTSILTAMSVGTRIRLSGWDLVLLDSSLNDQAYEHALRSGRRVVVNSNRQYLLAAIESIVRRFDVNGVPVVLVDSVDWQWNGTVLAPPRCPRSGNSSSMSLYATIAAHYKLPYASLQAAACASSPHALVDMWRAGCADNQLARDGKGRSWRLDARGHDCFMHPGRQLAGSTHAAPGHP